MQAQLQALQGVQVNQAISADKMQKQMDTIEQGMARILAALDGPTSDARSDPAPRVSPAPSSQFNANYKPKAKDPAQFENNDGDIKYGAWKQQMLDKFEEDQEQFASERSYMRYLFNRTKGDANEHLYPRYTSEEENQNPYTSHQEMFATLDSVYKNQFQVRDSRNAYRELKMGANQTFQVFRTKFLHLANGGRIPEADRFHDMYDKLTTTLQRQIVHQLHTLDEDFEKLCTVAAGIDVELRRINVRSAKEKEVSSGRPQPPLNRTLAPRPQTIAAQTRITNSATKPTGAGFALLQRPTPATPADLTAAKLPQARCYNCQELGHISRDCPKPKRATVVQDIELEEAEEVEGDSDEDQGNADA
jgi:hypothetical protein